MSAGGGRLAPVIKLLESCNLACTYCYQEDLLAPRRVMAEATLDRILAELARIRTAPLQILWFGGEPTLVGRRWFSRALELARSHLGAGGLRHAIQTNATLIDDPWAELLARHRFTVTVSLDGFAELHDLHRLTGGARKGTHATVVRGVRALQRAGIRPRASCVVTPETLPHAERLVEYFSELDVLEADFPPGMRFVGGRFELLVEARAYGEFMARVLERWLALGRPTSEFRIRSLAGLARAMSGLPPSFCKLEAGCAQYVTFGWDGTVYPCDEFAGMPDHVLGDIMETGLDRILASPRAGELHAAWTSTPTACASCEWLSVCRGGCPFERRLNGGVDQRSVVCEGLKVLYARMARELGGQGTPSPSAVSV
jgi:uncharacterized protein